MIADILCKVVLTFRSNIKALFESTSSAQESAQAHVPAVVLTMRVHCIRALGASDERTKPESESKATNPSIRKGPYSQLATLILLTESPNATQITREEILYHTNILTYYDPDS